MHMGFIDRVLYSNFAAYLKDDMPEVIKVRSIRAAFLRYGQLDRTSLKRALKWGTNPIVNVTNLTGEYGNFTPTPGNNVINIDRDLVNDFEAGRDWVRNKGGDRVHLAGVTVLHEMVHWADNIDGIDYTKRGGEEGELFEKAVYGKVLG